LDYAEDIQTACAGADVTLVLTEWEEFRRLEPRDLDSLVRHRRIIDGRNCLDREQWRSAGWEYRGLGRA
jgi:UDPglucose 6-dehydrogenase